MESNSARDIDRRLSDLVRSERHLVVQFVVELAAFAKRELYRELGYTSLFYYCVRQLGLSKSSAFRRSPQGPRPQAADAAGPTRGSGGGIRGNQTGSSAARGRQAARRGRGGFRGN